jgi:acetoin utilization deacetylase AcuC-like enzyme
VTTIFGYDDKFLEHQTGKHPERPVRLTSIVEKLRSNGHWNQLQFITERVEPDEWIRQIHSSEYIKRLKAACEDGLGFIDCPDSAISAQSYQVAREAVAMTLAACDRIISGRADNGFLALRPPGHHAEHDRSMGFCLFNNVAVAGRYLQKRHGITRVLILDWDVHHGNGTQHSFESDNTVFYGSLHQHPATLYPGTGWPNEIGKGLGRGTTLNLTLEPGAGDQECLEMFRENFLPAAQLFQPEFILISAGFDGHANDPLAQLNMTNEGYRTLAREMTALARQYCNGRLLSFLEGGYELEALSQCATEHIEILLD